MAFLLLESLDNFTGEQFIPIKGILAVAEQLRGNSPVIGKMSNVINFEKRRKEHIGVFMQHIENIKRSCLIVMNDSKGK